MNQKINWKANRGRINSPVLSSWTLGFGSGAALKSASQQTALPRGGTPTGQVFGVLVNAATGSRF